MTSYDPLQGLPNPEREPPSAAGLLGGPIPLVALREARALLADPALHATELVETDSAWRQAGPQGAAARARAPSLVALVEALATADADAATRLLASVVRAHALQALFFGLHHKISADPAPRGVVPSEKQLVEVWPRVYPASRTWVGPRVPDALLRLYRQRGPADRLGPAALEAVRASMAAGHPALAAHRGGAWLVAGESPSGLIAFDVIPGTSRAATLDGIDELRVADE